MNDQCLSCPASLVCLTCSPRARRITTFQCESCRKWYRIFHKYDGDTSYHNAFDAEINKSGCKQVSASKSCNLEFGYTCNKCVQRQERRTAERMPR